MYGFVIPDCGLNLLTKLLAGDSLRLSRVMVGSGRISPGADPALLTDLIQPVAAATSTVPYVNGKTCSFVVEYRSDLNGGLETGFLLNEFGVYAIGPDEEEVLLYYGTLGAYPQYCSAYTGGVSDVRRFPVVIALDNELKVEIQYLAASFLLAEDMDEYFKYTALPTALIEAQKLIDVHNADLSAHPDIRSTVAICLGMVERFEDMILANITGNPFLITFENLGGVLVTGVWNQVLQRIEF